MLVDNLPEQQRHMSGLVDELSKRNKAIEILFEDELDATVFESDTSPSRSQQSEQASGDGDRNSARNDGGGPAEVSESTDPDSPRER